jgi:hypothetical protein
LRRQPIPSIQRQESLDRHSEFGRDRSHYPSTFRIKVPFNATML